MLEGQGVTGHHVPMNETVEIPSGSDEPLYNEFVQLQ
jgi:hypothetical protein